MPTKNLFKDFGLKKGVKFRLEQYPREKYEVIKTDGIWLDVMCTEFTRYFEHNTYKHSFHLVNIQSFTERKLLIFGWENDKPKKESKIITKNVQKRKTKSKT